MKAAFHRGLVM